jgi:Domain of unknown function (DUF4288)
MREQKWFAVRCFFLIEAGSVASVLSERGQMYEERITIWQAESSEEAFEKAFAEADRYAAEASGTELIDYATSYELYDPPADGAEVWSLMRDSWLPPKEYIERYVIEGDPHAGPYEGEAD